MGFRDDIELILQATPKERQTVFFSATIPRPIQQLIEKYSRNPEQVRMEQTALTVPTVEQVYYEVDRRHKIELLTRLIDIHDLKLGIIFCNTKRMVDELVDHLEAQGYMADRLHGDMNQAQRDRVMNKFRKFGLEFLVATDIAARGIDVDDVQVVFNYDLPYDAEDYLHRIGRTGRAGRSGRAISFVAGREMFQISNIERFTKTKIQRGKPPTAGEVEDARANVFLDQLRATLQNSEFQRQNHLIEVLLEEGYSSTDIASALLHHLQSGAAASPAKASREEKPSRQDRAFGAPIHEGRQDRQAGRGDLPPRFEDPREERLRREERPHRETPPAKPAIGSSRAISKSAETAPAMEVKIPQPEIKASTKAKTGIQKTYSDKEILASVPLEAPKKLEPKRALRPPSRRRTPDNQTRLWMNVGEEMGIVPLDIVNTIAGETGLPGKVVGAVDIRERHLFVDVGSEHVKGIIAKLNRTQIKSHKLKVKVA
jgi:ATP-dependent RNA helicase DeaD